MFKAHLFMFLAFILLMTNLVCMFLDGSWLGAQDVTLMGWLTGYEATEASGIGRILSLSWGFMTEGLPRMIMWNFSFLRGGLEIIRWVLMSISIGVIGGLAVQFAPSIPGFFARR